MSDYLYNMQINEIEGEIASLKITLKNTADSIRAKEIEEEINQLDEQLKKIKEKSRKKDFDNFRKKYKNPTKNKKLLYKEENSRASDDYLGPTGYNEYTEEDREI